MAESNFVDYVKSIAVPVRAAEAPRTCGVKNTYPMAAPTVVTEDEEVT